MAESATFSSSPGGKFVTGVTKHEKVMVILFLLTLPLINPWVRGDGVGYYAFARAPLIEHSLDFRQDWIHANSSFKMKRTVGEENIAPTEITRTGHLNDHFSVGPAMLWAPFLLVTHLGVLAINALGAHVAADGFSRPYLVAMAVGTALYGFAGLWISYRLARKYVSQQWAFLATLGIWFASSLPVYMYFNPSWSHAHSAFIVAVFLWYWLETRPHRTLPQWTLLGAIGGLMMDVYYINAVLLVLPLIDSLSLYYSAVISRSAKTAGSVLVRNLAFSAALVVAFLPTLVAKKVIYGSYFNFGYNEGWFWKSPAFFKTAFSADHGFLVWTPILLLAVIGLVCLGRLHRELALALSAALLIYLYVVGCYQDWDGLSSFGNRFFVSFTAVFVIGLAALFEWLAREWAPRIVWKIAVGITVLLVMANLSLIFQWGTHLIPSRGSVSWRTVVHNQVAVVPGVALDAVKRYLTSRGALMNQIEEEDVRQLKAGHRGSTP